MRDLKKRIEELQSQLKKHRRTGLKEYPTRAIFIDPLLGALGWDVRDTEEVGLEYPTIDGKAVDYALKINKKVVALVEAKALDDPLDDVKSITQVVGYAANDGVEWCVLTNGARYKVYSSSSEQQPLISCFLKCLLIRAMPLNSRAIRLHRTSAAYLVIQWREAC